MSQKRATVFARSHWTRGLSILALVSSACGELIRSRLATNDGRTDTQTCCEGSTRCQDPCRTHVEVPSKEEPLHQSNASSGDSPADQRRPDPVDVSTDPQPA